MKIENDKVVTLDYKVYDMKTGEILEDTKEFGPLLYLTGHNNFVPAIEEALEGKEKGFSTIIELTPEQGYGEYDEDLVIEMEKSDFEDFDDLYEGLDFIADMEDGSELTFVITEVKDDVVITDGNHPFAGKNLKFDIVVTDVREATDDELEKGAAHFHGFAD